MHRQGWPAGGSEQLVFGPKSRIRYLNQLGTSVEEWIAIYWQKEWFASDTSRRETKTCSPISNTFRKDRSRGGLPPEDSLLSFCSFSPDAHPRQGARTPAFRSCKRAAHKSLRASSNAWTRQSTAPMISSPKSHRPPTHRVSSEHTPSRSNDPRISSSARPQPNTRMKNYPHVNRLNMSARAMRKTIAQ
jgi:hypothetical protein